MVYRIVKGNNSTAEYDTRIQQIVGDYATYEEAYEQLPDGLVVNDMTEADHPSGEAWYAPGTDEEDMDGYDVLLFIIRVHPWEVA